MMMLCFGVAKELGKDVIEVYNWPLEILLGWSAYFGIQNKEQQKRLNENKARSGRSGRPRRRR